MSNLHTAFDEEDCPMSEDLVLCRPEPRPEGGAVAWVTFNNPTQRNAIGTAGKARFVKVMAGLAGDESLRAVVLTGAGDKAFVGGADLKQMKDFDTAQARASCLKTHQACDAVRMCPVPVIARINGFCFGAGMEIAACADMRVGAAHARFGIPSGMEACVLPRLIGWGKAVELVLTGDHIDAAEAHRIGFLQKLVPAAELDAAVEAWLASILACGPRAVRIQKRLNQDWERMAITDAARAGMQAYVDAFRTDEPQRMMTAFVNRPRRA
jgi:enoyl-CoA hydratase/carnithine racemase